jgi:hypothetical protein
MAKANRQIVHYATFQSTAKDYCKRFNYNLEWFDVNIKSLVLYCMVSRSRHGVRLIAHHAHINITILIYRVYKKKRNLGIS